MAAYTCWQSKWQKRGLEIAEVNGIKYVLKNEQTGHFHCWRKSDDKLFQFYAGTGKIQGYDRARDIHALIRMLTK